MNCFRKKYHIFSFIILLTVLSSILQSRFIYNNTVNHHNNSIYYIIPTNQFIFFFSSTSVQVHHISNDSLISTMTQYYAIQYGNINLDMSDDQKAFLYVAANRIIYYLVDSINLTFHSFTFYLTQFTNIKIVKFLNSKNFFLVRCQNGGFRIYQANILSNNTISSVVLRLDYSSWGKNIFNSYRDQFNQRLYITLLGFQTIYYLNISSFDPNSYQNVFQIPMIGTSTYKTNMKVLKNGNLIIEQYNLTTQTYFLNVYQLNLLDNSFLLKGSYQNVKHCQQLNQFDESLIFGLDFNSVIQISLKQNTFPIQYLQLMSNSTYPSNNLTLSNCVTQKAFKIQNQTFIIAFQHQQSYYHYFKVEAYTQCVQSINNCYSCNLLNNLKQCTKCKVPALLNYDSINNFCLIPNVFIRLDKSTCPFEYYQYIDDPSQCLKIICQVQNCQQCLFRSDTCNKCNQETLLIEGACLKHLLYPSVKQYANITGTVLSVPGVKVYVGPLSPFFIWLDDYWYYIYHNRNYSIGIKIVFDTIKFVNQLKISPQFIDLDGANQKFNISKLLISDYLPYTPLSFYQQSKNDIQFLKNTYKMYTWNYISGLVVFILFRIIFIIFVKCIKPKNKSVLGVIKDFFMQNSLYKCLFLILIQQNLIIISFYGFLQLVYPSSFNFQDKLNIIFALLFLFSAIFFSFSFYILMYALYQKQEAQIFLRFTKGCNIKGYLSQTFLVGLKNFFNGFIHAYLIQNYSYQILSLSFLKLILAISVIVFRNSYQSYGIFISFFVYFFTGFIFDLILYFDKERQSSQYLLDEIQIIALGLLMITISVCILSLAVNFLKKISFYFEKNLKIAKSKIKPIKKRKGLKFQKNQEKTKNQVSFKDKIEDNQQKNDFLNSEKTAKNKKCIFMIESLQKDKVSVNQSNNQVCLQIKLQHQQVKKQKLVFGYIKKANFNKTQQCQKFQKIEKEKSSVSKNQKNKEDKYYNYQKYLNQSIKIKKSRLDYLTQKTMKVRFFNSHQSQKQTQY